MRRSRQSVSLLRWAGVKAPDYLRGVLRRQGGFCARCSRLVSNRKALLVDGRAVCHECNNRSILNARRTCRADANDRPSAV